MWVAIDGESSPKAHVESGVPQGTVLGPSLLLLFINDLPDVVSVGTTVRLFADDCLVYRKIKSVEDQEVLQRDLTALDNWARRWAYISIQSLQVQYNDSSPFQICIHQEI